MAKIIALFNHKGGVGKTTLAHNMAFSLSDAGKKVLLMDADPQMNLTAAVYGLSTSIEYSTDQESKWSQNCEKYISLSEYLDMYLKGETTNKTKFQIQSKISSSGFVDLISGSISLAENEGDLYQIIKNANTYTKNIASKFQQALSDTKKDYDFVIVDTSPSASSIINALHIMSSDYLITPVSPAFFSLQAIDNLSNILKNWSELLQPYQTTTGFSGINFEVKFLGLVVQLAKRYKGGGKNWTSHATEWIKDVNKSVKKFQKFALSRGHAVTEPQFQEIFPDAEPFIIETCCDFTPQLRSIAEKEGVPVLHINQEICQKHNKQVDLTKKDGQYKLSLDSVQESYKKITDGLLRLKQIDGSF